MLRILSFVCSVACVVSANAEDLEKPNFKSVFDKQAIEDKGEALKQQAEGVVEGRALKSLNGSVTVEKEPTNTLTLKPRSEVVSEKLNLMNKGLSNQDEPKLETDARLELFQSDRVKINKSLFFNDDSVRNINVIQRAYLETVKDEEIEDQIVEGEAGSIINSILEGLEATEIEESVEYKAKRIPAYYYLSSIIYRTPQNSAIWLNGMKFNVGDEFNGLKVRYASKDRVSFRWNIDEKRLNMSEWKSKAEANRKYSIGKIKIDLEERFVDFSLQTNQMLDAKNMVIIEGKRVEGLASNLGDLYYDPAAYDPSDPDSILTVLTEKLEAKEKAAEAIDSEEIEFSEEVKSDEEILKELRQQGEI